MDRRLLAVLAGIVFSAMCSVCWGRTYVQDEVLVKFRPGTSAAEVSAAIRPLRGRVLKTFKRVRAHHVGLGRAPAAPGASQSPGRGIGRSQRPSVPAALQALRRNPNVIYAEPNYILHADVTPVLPNDPDYGELWGMDKIRAPEAWSISTGGTVVVADIDSGVDYNHEDLAANMWTNAGEIAGNGIDDDSNGFIDDTRGWDFVQNDNDPMDKDGHGTHTAGTIGAVGNNATGVVGVNWTVKIMPLRFLSHGTGSTSDAVSCIEYAIANGAHVMSNSWGGGDFSRTLYDAIALARDAGILFVAAAGNDSDDTDTIPHYPSSYDLDNIISVAATDDADALASFSSYGDTSVDLAAPGVGIYSTIRNDRYDYFDGTSMATPHVAGAVALIQAALGESGSSAKSRILATVDHVVGLEGLMVSEGRLNLYATLSQTAMPNIVYDGHDIVSTTDGDAAAEPGEDVTMTVGLENFWEDATNVTATLSTSDGYISVTPAAATQSYGDIAGGASSTNATPYALSVSGAAPAGHVVTFVLDIAFDGGTDQTSFDLVILGDADVMFVDDDGGTSFEGRFTDALDTTGYSYIVWETATLGSPSATDLASGRAVLWNTGPAFATTLSAYDQAQLSAYMNGGGKLFLASQDVLWDIGLTSFMRNYVHVDAYVDDRGCGVAQGMSGDPISDSLNLPLSYPFIDYSDDLTPDGSSAAIFDTTEVVSTWPVALRYPAADSPSGGGTVVFLAFPFEAVAAAERTTLMGRILDWLLPPVLTGPPFADDDDYTLSGGPFLFVPAPGVLGNDTDPDGDPITASLQTPPSLGFVVFNPDGSFLYALPFDTTGTDTFTYKANDGGADGNAATVTITLSGLPPSPITTVTVADNPADGGGAINSDWAGYMPPPDFDSYNIYRSTSPFGDVSGMTPIGTGGYAALTSYTDATATNGVDYYYTATRVDTDGNESVAAPAVGPVQSTDDGGPPRITTLTAEDVPDDYGGAVTLQWSPYAPPGDFGQYRIYRSLSAFNNVTGWIPIVTLDDPARTTRRMAAGIGVDYWYAVTCTDTDGNEDASVYAVGPIHSVDNLGGP